MLSAAGISVSLMQTLIIPLIPELPKLLNASPSNASWAITATLLTAAVATPVFGRLGDMYGPKPMLIACAVVLTAGSLVAATHQFADPVRSSAVACRGFGDADHSVGHQRVAGVGARRTRRQRNGFDERVAGGGRGARAAAVRGDRPALRAGTRCSGSRPGSVSWRRSCCSRSWCRRCPSSSSDRLDPLGAILLAGGLVTLLLGISKGQSWGWTSATTLALFGCVAGDPRAVRVWQLRVSTRRSSTCAPRCGCRC